VRISPIEVHLSDPDNYDRIYYQHTKYVKAPEQYVMFGAKTSAFSTIDNDLHRIRRGVMNPLFSRKRVLELEDVVQSKVQKLMDRTESELKIGKPVDLHYGFRAISIDVITDYAFDICYDLLDEETPGLDFNNMIRGFASGFWTFEMFPILMDIVLSMPPHWGNYLGEPLRSYAAFVKVSPRISSDPKSSDSYDFRVSTTLLRL